MKRAVIWTAVSSQAQAQDDKISLQLQERNARAWCEANGYTVVTALTVPGHSRSESDIITLFEDYAALGVFAYHDLRKMWQAKAFDVLVAYSKDRLARSATGITWVIENTIKAGAMLFMTDDAGGGGWITPENYRFSAAIGGIAVTGQMEHLRAKTAEVRKSKVARGVPQNARQIPYTHRAICNERGAVVGLELDPDKARFREDLKSLFLAGVSWTRIEDALWQRGHGRHGKPFGKKFIYGLMHNPAFYGHSALRWRATNLQHGQNPARWIYDPEVPMPSHVQIHYNTHAAAYAPDDMALIIAELKRRIIVRAGRGRTTEATKQFTGLIRCGICGKHMAYHCLSGSSVAQYRCNPNLHTPATRKHSDHRYVLESDVIASVDRVLRRFMESGDLSTPAEPTHAGQLASIQAEIEDVETRIQRLIQRQAGDISPKVASMYDAQIREYSAQLDNLTRTQQSLIHELEDNRRAVQLQGIVLNELQSIGVDNFWTLPATRINQYLHRVLAGWRIVYDSDKVIRLKRRKSSTY